MKRLILFALLILATALTAQAQTEDFLSMKGPRNPVRIDQRLGVGIPLDLQFRDETGRSVRLRDYFDGRHPVVLTLVYYSCPMLCSMVLDAETNSLSNIKLDLATDYRAVTISFDPRDTPATASEKKQLYSRRYGRPGAVDGWHFLTGDVAAIREITDAVGFRYQWDAKSGQFAHPTAVIVLTPQGKISRYFYGIDFPSRDLRLGLVEASGDKIGNPTDQFLLLCYHYDASTGRYGRITMNAVRAGGLATVLGVAGLIFLAIRRERIGAEGREG